jgi:hypothetical protein
MVVKNQSQPFFLSQLRCRARLRYKSIFRLEIYKYINKVLNFISKSGKNLFYFDWVEQFHRLVIESNNCSLNKKLVEELNNKVRYRVMNSIYG